MKVILILLSLMLAMGNTSFSQSKKKKKQKKIEKTEAIKEDAVTEVVEQVSVLEDKPTSVSAESGLYYKYITTANYTIVQKTGSSGYSSIRYGLTRNSDGSLILPVVFHSIVTVSGDDDDRFVVKMNEKYGIFNVKFGFELPVDYGSIEANYSKPYIIAKKKGGYGLIDKADYRIILPFEYGFIAFVSGENNLVILENEKEQYGVFNLLTNKFSIDPLYQSISSAYFEKFLILKRNDLYNISDNKGNL